MWEYDPACLTGVKIADREEDDGWPEDGDGEGEGARPVIEIVRGAECEYCGGEGGDNGGSASPSASSVKSRGSVSAYSSPASPQLLSPCQAYAPMERGHGWARSPRGKCTTLARRTRRGTQQATALGPPTRNALLVPDALALLQPAAVFAAETEEALATSSAGGRRGVSDRSNGRRRGGCGGGPAIDGE